MEAIMHGKFLPGRFASTISAYVQPLLGLLLFALLAACTDSGGGDGSGTPSSGSNRSSTLASITEVAPGDTCPAGGQQIHYGIDENGNGLLDEAEIDGSVVICHGASGSSTQVSLTEEGPGASCAYGGTRIDIWQDTGAGGGTAGDGIPQEGEILQTRWLCHQGTGVSEGSVATPVTLTPWATRHASVAAASTSYYQFTATANDTFLIELLETDSDLRWTLYTDPAFTSNPTSCDGHTGVNADEACGTSALTNGQTYYLKVEERSNMPNLFDALVSHDLLVGADDTGKLHRVDPATGDTTLLYDTGLGPITALGYARASGVLYAGTGSGAACPNCLYALDPFTGTGKPFLAQDDLLSGMAVRPWDGTPYVVFYTECPTLDIVDPRTGQRTPVVDQNFPSCAGNGGFGLTFDGSGALLMTDFYSDAGGTNHYPIYLMGQYTDSATYLGDYLLDADTMSGIITAMATRPSDGEVFILTLESTDAGDLVNLGTLDLSTFGVSHVGDPIPILRSLEVLSRVPAAPYPPVRDFSAVDGQNADVVLTWQDYPLSTSYNIYWSDDTDLEIDPANPDTYKGVLVGVGGSTSYTHWGLPPGNTYYYRIVPVIRGTPGPASSEVSATPTSP